MYAVVLALVLAVVLYLIGRPLFQPDPEEEALLLQVPLGSADLERERVFGALEELEADYEMHKLSEADYRELKAEYARQALEYLKSAPAGGDRAGRIAGRVSPVSRGRRVQVDLSELEAEAEAEVALALELAGESGGGKATAAPGAREAAGVGGNDGGAGGNDRAAAAHCPHCGVQLLSADQKFCHACGKVQREEA